MAGLNGKGAMVWKIRTWEGGVISRMVAQALDLGLQWVSLKIIDGTLERWENEAYFPDNQNQDFLPELVAALTDAGVDVNAWGWTYGRTAYAPYNSIAVAEARKTVELMARYRALGMSLVYLVDAESHYRRTRLNMKAEATKYVDAFDAKCVEMGVPVERLLCSYRYPVTYQPDFPAKEFLAGSKKAAPQVYFIGATSDKGGAYQLEKSFGEYAGLGVPAAEYVGIGPTYNHNGWVASGIQLTKFFEKAVELGHRGAGVWDLPQATTEQLAAIKAFTWAGEEPPEEPEKTLEERVTALEVEARKRGWEV
jgi:hypothetical protein